MKEKFLDDILPIIIGIIGGVLIVYLFNTYFPKFEKKYAYEINYIVQKFKGNDIKKTQIKSTNEYSKDYDFEFVQLSDYIYPSNKKDLLNIIYTFFNSGQEKLEFYCKKEYKDCIDDFREIVNGEDDLLHYINTFVNPYNEYSNFKSSYDYDTSKIKITKTNKYSDEKIKEMENKIDDIYTQLVDPNKSTYDNIKAIHDYILYHTVYDHDKSDFMDGVTEEDSIYESQYAYGPLIEGQAICSGYSALMALFLDKMGLENMRISSGNHMWNAVKIDDKWYNLDLTWDDDKNDNIKYKYFLIDTKKMLTEDSDSESHQYYQDIYYELNYSR